MDGEKRDSESSGFSIHLHPETINESSKQDEPVSVSSKKKERKLISSSKLQTLSMKSGLTLTAVSKSAWSKEDSMSTDSDKNGGNCLKKSLVFTAFIVTVVILCLCSSAGVFLLSHRQFLAFQRSLQSFKQDLSILIEATMQSVTSLESSLNKTKQSVTDLEFSLDQTRRTLTQNFDSSLDFTRQSVIQSLNDSMNNVRHNYSTLNLTLSSFMKQTQRSLMSLESSLNITIHDYSNLNQTISFNNGEFIAHKQSVTTSVLPPINSSIDETKRNYSTLEQVILSNYQEFLTYTQYVNNSYYALHSHSRTSCSAILTFDPNSPSGHYWIRSSIGTSVLVYCDMTRSCGGITGGWMRVVEFDMSVRGSRCPQGFTRFKNTCTISSEPCSSTAIDLSHISYSRVCGKIIAYQIGTPDAFHGGHGDIDSPYVDGVSLTTHGFPRQHIWSFAAAATENFGFIQNACPCSISSHLKVPTFVENDYFCDTGNEGGYSRNTFYGDDPLWDGYGCRNTPCCFYNTPPWFFKQLPYSSTDNIDMRVCIDQSLNDENIGIESITIYVY